LEAELAEEEKLAAAQLEAWDPVKDLLEEEVNNYNNGDDDVQLAFDGHRFVNLPPPPVFNLCIVCSLP
jgi:hypothetical protein